MAGFTDGNQIAAVVVRAVDAEKVNLTDVISVLKPTLIPMDAARSELNATVFNSACLALHAMNTSGILKENIRSPRCVSKRRPDHLAAPNERCNDLDG